MKLYENYKKMAIGIIGETKYTEIFKKHNLDTKKWTIGRIKPFVKEIEEEIKEKLESRNV